MLAPGKLYFLICAICLSMARRQFRGYKVFRVFPNSQEHIQELQSLQEDEPEIDFWTEATLPGNPVDVNVPPGKQIRFRFRLARSQIKHEVHIHDIDKLIRSENTNTNTHRYGSNRYNYAKFNNYKRMVLEMRKLHLWTPSITSLFVISVSNEGRKIYAIKIQSDKRKNKKIIFINCGIHAREWISPATCMYIIKELILGHRHSSVVKKTLEKFDFVILPVFNVDGYEHSHTSSRLWRKTRTPYGQCFGADPNRNWSFKWSAGVGTSDNPCSEIYRGPHAFSEVEVRDIAQYLQNIRKELVSYYDVHAYSQMWLTPWSYTKRTPADWPEIERVAKVAVDAIQAPFGTKYKYGQPAKILYGVSGGSIDWVYGVLGVKYSFALELRDTGKYGFLLPATQILPTGYETLRAILAAVNAMKVQ